RLLFRFLKELLAIDHERGVQVLPSWRQWLVNTDNEDTNEFQTKHDYADYRALNCCLLPFSAMYRYVMKLDLSMVEIEAVTPIQHQACAVIGLVNDYWSWPKGKAVLGDQLDRLMNGVSVLMRLDGVDERQALERVKSLAIEYESNLIKLCYDLPAADGNVRQDFRWHVHAHIRIVSKNGLWGSP
ncbi:isoprenoid synthase domain-containing protein, partial [Calycina marina]